MVGDPPVGCQCCCHEQSRHWTIPDSGGTVKFDTEQGTLKIPPPSLAELRDDFAQAALQGLIASFTEKDRTEWQTKFKMDNKRIAQQFAHDAYEIADAMLRVKSDEAGRESGKGRK